MGLTSKRKMNKNLFSHYDGDTYQPDKTDYVFKSPCNYCYIRTVKQGEQISNGLPGDLYQHLGLYPHYLTQSEIGLYFKKLGLKYTLPLLINQAD